MNVQKADPSGEPGYPDAKEFLAKRAALGAAILGVGVALGGCADTTPLGGVWIRPDKGSSEGRQSSVPDPSGEESGESSADVVPLPGVPPISSGGGP